MKKSELTLIPIAGLCNRINVLRSAIGLVEHCHNVKIKIYWQKTHDCCANFEDLFEPISDNILVGNITMNKLKSIFLIPPYRWTFGLTPKFRKIFFDAEFRGSTISNDTIEDYFDKFQKLYIYSDNRFCRYSTQIPLSDIFHPTSEIEDRINNVVKKYTKNTVGVHIRRTDNVASINGSPIEKFYQIMDREISENEDTAFYIASDSELVKSNLKDKYGNRIITADWELKRNTVKGMKDAVAELFCLGRTSKIIGSKASTYSIIASEICNIPLILD
ncbi:hypothetical protein [uncultured Bacteroides sp.]|uniref:hypothetical protein n=1 Tax=uncultured Bacteroides sp. TaxID=162156 RepID=UPI002AA8E8EA|nr:hypothetical protein [uncultured Bacteroides sp.]